jgi:hypothetical protein
MKIAVVALSCVLATAALAQTTRTWQQDSAEDFAKGTASGVAVLSTGALELAPSQKTLATLNSPFLWSMAVAETGDLFVAASSPARLYRITPQGRVTIVFTAAELQVQAVATAPGGVLYAATLPGGKIYKIQRGKNTAAKDKDSDSEYTASLFFETKHKYVWALAADAQGHLFAATGEAGDLYRIEANGQGKILFHCPQTHLRSLQLLGDGSLIAGTDGGGLVYRIAPDGEAKILYSAAKPEITALLADAKGNIYLAAVGEKNGRTRHAAAAMPTVAAAPSGGIISSVNGSNITVTPVQQAGGAQGGFLPPMATGGSQIVRLDAEGAPHVLWSPSEEIVYSLAMAPDGRLLAGTGNEGKLYAIDNTGASALLLNGNSSQLTALVQATPEGTFYAAGSNPGRIQRIAFDSAEGSFESEVFDAHKLSRWGRLEAVTKGNVELYTRSGNAESTVSGWSQWQKADKDSRVISPEARYLQYKAVLRGGNPEPRLESTRLYYLPHHYAPEITELSAAVNSRMNAAGQSSHERGWTTLRWSARSESEETLSYSVAVRDESGQRWLPLKSGLTAASYSFESTQLPDGYYVARITASDEGSETPGQQLSSNREGSRFLVDNTPPAISPVAVQINGAEMTVSFEASDALSVVQKAEFSIDGGDWHHLSPVGGLADSLKAFYRATLPLPAGDAVTEHVVTVRVQDAAENQSLARRAFSSAR